MGSLHASWAGLPLLPRCVLLGAALAGAAGALAGLVVGLMAYAPTAWFAVVELGLPATVVGAVIGLMTGAIVLVARRIARTHAGGTS